jgi:hypothetical protein
MWTGRGKRGKAKGERKEAEGKWKAERGEGAKGREED